MLDIIHDDFKDVVEEHRIKIHSFQESLAPSGVKGVKGKVSSVAFKFELYGCQHRANGKYGEDCR